MIHACCVVNHDQTVLESGMFHDPDELKSIDCCDFNHEFRVCLESPILLPKVPLSVGLDQEENGGKSIFTNSNMSNCDKSSEKEVGGFGISGFR